MAEMSKLEEIVRELEAANQELQAFSDALAHDLRSPLLIVTNFSHQLHESLGNALTDQQKDDLQRIRAAGLHMVHIIDDLRDLSDVNRAEITRSEVDLSSLARGIINDLCVLVPDRDVTFEAEPGIKAFGDRTLLKILLTNLLQNAWKYTAPKEDAWIELGITENKGDLPTYYVRDNGIGFDNENHELFSKPSNDSIPGRSTPGADSGSPPWSESCVATAGEYGARASPERGRSSALLSVLLRPTSRHPLVPHQDPRGRRGERVGREYLFPEGGRRESRLSMSLGYSEIDSQRPMSMPSSDTLMISPFAAMPGMPSVTRKAAFFMSSLRRKGYSPKLGRQQAGQIWPGGVVLTYPTKCYSGIE